MSKSSNTPEPGAGGPADPGWAVDVGRPLTARSVIASTLLGMDPPRLPVQALVRSGELFGVAAGTTRVALSRMVAAGELTADDGTYHLAGPLLSRHVRQQASRRAARGRWDGTWEQWVVVAERRSAADRSRFRHAVAQLRLAELREGVWLRPANLDPDRSPESAAVAAEHTDRFVVRPDVDGAALAGRLWELDAWARRARDLQAALVDGRPALDAGDTSALAPTFVLAAAVLRHFQSDPLLPEELLPAGWPGPALREEYEGFVAAFQATWRAWYRAGGATVVG